MCQSSKKPSVLTIIVILGIAALLRPQLSMLGPLATVISTRYDLLQFAFGLLTTVPLAVFALSSIFVPRLGKRIGEGRLLLLALLLMAIGSGLRGMGGVWPLYAWTAILGLGISIGNVTLPALIKKLWPDSVGVMTGLYTTLMVIFAAVGAGTAYPLLELRGDWRDANYLWAFLALLIFAIALAPLWSLRLRERGRSTLDTVEVVEKPTIYHLRPLHKEPLAWALSGFMGLQSFLFYAMLTWLPSLALARGLAEEGASLAASAFQLIGIPCAFITPIIASKYVRQRILPFALGSTGVLGLTCLLWPSVPLFWLGVTLLAIACGSTMPLAMTYFSLRTTTASRASALSGMAQSVGYTLAALGPILVGILLDLSNGSWTLPILLLIVTTTVMTILATISGKASVI